MLNRNHVVLMRDIVAICWRKYKLPVAANGVSEIFLSVKIEITMSLTNLYKLNMIKCSLGCLSIYIPRPFPPVWGVADNTKETNKNNGGFTPFFQQ